VNSLNLKRQAIIDHLVQYAITKIDKKNDSDFLEFLKEYYRNFPIDDISNVSNENLFGVALSHWRLAQKKDENTTNLNIFNPTVETSGWYSSNTVIQMVIDDLPFLVDSIKMELSRLGCSLHLVANFAGLKVYRDNKGNIKSIDNKLGSKEAFLVFFVSHLSEEEEIAEVKAGIESVIQDVKVCVNDWQDMKDSMQESINEIDSLGVGFDKDDVEETKKFLEWLLEYFTFMGARSYDSKGIGSKKGLYLVKDSGLGVLRDDSGSKVTRLYSELPPDTRKIALSKQILMISKTNTQSTIHRNAYTDVIGIKRFNKLGRVIGEKRFIGLFTSDAYDSDPSKIPILRKKVKDVISLSGFEHNLHANKRLLHILKNLPRDELLQIGTSDLCAMALGILEIQDKKKIKMFVRRDIFNRFVSCLVYIPRDNFNTELRLQIQDILLTQFDGLEVVATPSFSESHLARVHFIIRIDSSNVQNYDYEAIESLVVKVARSWKDELHECLIEKYGDQTGVKYYNLFARSFSAGYKDHYSPHAAASDINYINKLSPENDIEISVYRPSNFSNSFLAIKLFQINSPIPLSEAVHILENMNLKVISEKSFTIRSSNQNNICVSDFEMKYTGKHEVNIESLGIEFQKSFRSIWHGEAENDRFNSLIIDAKLSCFHIIMLRAYARYLRQIGFNFSEKYIQETFTDNTEVTKKLVELFECRFNPEIYESNPNAYKVVYDELLDSLETIESIDDDRIVRKYLEVILATDRTNYYQDLDGKEKLYLSLKLAPHRITNMPLPKPKHETFVYSPRFEGLHLRFDSVARGGIRWSDRQEDFRTEVLGLMKAQQVKNSVIVPSGAKGVFVPKCLDTNMTRDEIQAEGVSCYKNFISGLLDLTDNFFGGNEVSPKNTVCHDEKDLYLVVAADKGTATFSDTANELAAEYGFWLGDAFASGGSVGYDHKKMGITAKGAWESVKRHFLEADININEPFTVLGIGDMGGDVFGNGMLLSKNIKLLAAFNHKHIFIDPDPNPSKSFNERKRLFEMPVSQWSDYNKKLISKGGGVFTRSSKYITISNEMTNVFGIDADRLSPDELIHELLKIDVDLLWNGGIGTYVKSVSETNIDVGDRSNDSLRINGCELKAKVVGEGGNLGITQLGRIEYELSGGRINTDFIDNSAGVNCSDHEVNIKILLNHMVDSGDMTIKSRNALLEEMTNDVSELVLYDSFKQNIALSMAVHLLSKHIDLYERFMIVHSKSGKINLELEFLPQPSDLVKRKTTGKSLTRPELSVLFSYSKIILREQILKSDFMQDEFILKFMEKAFPSKITSKYKDKIYDHYLSKEITATMLCNQFILEMGITFVQQLQDELGSDVYAIVKSYVVARTILDIDNIIKEVDAYYDKIPAYDYLDILSVIRMIIRRITRWILRNKKNLSITELIDRYASDAEKIMIKIPEIIDGSEKKDFNKVLRKMLSLGMNSSLATKIATYQVASPILNIEEAAKESDMDCLVFAAIYFKLSNKLGINWLRNCINDYNVKSRWDVLARVSAQSDLDRYQRAITNSIINVSIENNISSSDTEKMINYWFQTNKIQIDRWMSNLAEIHSVADLDFAIISVIIKELFNLAYIGC
jgi:glutamate dehydrogenase